MLLLVSSLVLCACANGLAVGENKAAPSPLKYETYADAGRYLFSPASQNWTDASKVCKNYNGHLAYPKTQDEADALWSIMTRYNVEQVHIGFHDQFTEGEYYTAKGRLITETPFDQWSSGAPIGVSSRNCGGLMGDGLVDVACSDTRPSICEENEPTDGGGFLDYDYIEGHGYYKYYEVAQAEYWSTALKICYNDGAHLLILNSQEEHDAVFNKYNIYLMWMGVHQLFADRYFVTIFDDDLESTGYTKWIQGEPAGTHYSYPYVRVGATGLAVDMNTKRTFICERSNSSGSIQRGSKSP